MTSISAENIGWPEDISCSPMSWPSLSKAMYCPNINMYYGLPLCEWASQGSEDSLRCMTSIGVQGIEWLAHIFCSPGSWPSPSEAMYFQSRLCPTTCRLTQGMSKLRMFATMHDKRRRTKHCMGGGHLLFAGIMATAVKTT